MSNSLKTPLWACGQDMNDWSVRDADGLVIAKWLVQDYAEEIVRAVNSHAVLVEAGKMFTEHGHAGQCGRYCSLGCTCGLLEMKEALLALAKGEKPQEESRS